ncbi:MAG: CvpA family protein [Rubripirellula sp.]
MEIYDIIMLIVLGGAMVFGAIKGFAWQLASIASITVSYVVAYKFREPFSQSIQADPPWNKFLAMLILYIGTALVVWVAFRMVSTTIDRLRLREFDRQIGALFGLAKGALYCILITLFAVTLMGERIRGTIVQSTSGRYIAKVLDRSQAVIPPEIHEVVQPYLERFDDRFNSDGWEQSEPTFNRMPWLAGQQEQAPSANTTGQNWQTSFGVAQNQNAPADRRQWPAQQAQQQQTWNNFQR